MKLNFSGKLYEVASYGVREDTHVVDMDQVRETALREKPQVLIAGWSAYPRHLDFAAFARSPTRSAPSCGSTWRTSPVWSPRVCIRRRSRMRTSSPPPSTRPSVAPAPA